MKTGNQDRDFTSDKRPDIAEPPAVVEPGGAQIYDYLMYGLSLPERALRATSAIVGGTLSESAALLVPMAFRSSKSYEIFVQQMLDLMVRDVAGVEHEASADRAIPTEVEGYIARKAVGSFIDMAGMATLHLSPLTVLAIVSDVAYGSQTYLKELSDELKKAGVISEETTIDHASDLLDAVRNASNVAADAFDQPPLSVAGLQETIAQTYAAAAKIDATDLIPQSEMQQMWDEIHALAEREGVSAFDISSAMSLYAIDKVGQLQHATLSSVRVAGNMFDRHIFDHYRQALYTINEEGLYAMVARTSRPYIAAVWKNFSSERETLTEDLLSGALLGRAWSGVRGWFIDAPSASDRPADRPDNQQAP